MNTSHSALFGLFILIVGVCTAQKVPVHVYYESLCPDSQAFITQQLYPAMKSPLGRLVNLKLVPFGKSNYSTLGSDVQFDCHHGPNECYGNKIQSCAIEHIEVDSYQNQNTKESLTLEYINCLMELGKNFADSPYPGERCAKEIHIQNWETIQNCANKSEGSKLLQQNGELTQGLKPTLTSVPTITFRYQQEPASQALALVNFRSALCKQMQTPMPIECANIPNSAAVEAINSYIIGLSFLTLIIAMQL